MDWVGLLIAVLLLVLFVGFQAGLATFFMTGALRKRRDAHTRRRWRAVLLFSAAAWSLVAVAIVLDSRPWDRQELPLWSAFAVLNLAASLVAEWGITDKPSLAQRLVRRLMRRPIGG
jgi:hypothetical protein